MTPSALFLGIVLSVTDGDTLRVQTPWVDTPFSVMGLRVAGIDAPETRKPPAKCADEVVKGREARIYARGLVGPGEPIGFVVRGLDKYGRLLASVTLPSGRDLATEMIAAGLAKPYAGRIKPSWC